MHHEKTEYRWSDIWTGRCYRASAVSDPYDCLSALDKLRRFPGVGVFKTPIEVGFAQRVRALEMRTASPATQVDTPLRLARRVQELVDARAALSLPV